MAGQEPGVGRASRPSDGLWSSHSRHRPAHFPARRFSANVCFLSDAYSRPVNRANPDPADPTTPIPPPPHHPSTDDVRPTANQPPTHRPPAGQVLANRPELLPNGCELEHRGGDVNEALPDRNAGHITIESTERVLIEHTPPGRAGDRREGVARSEHRGCAHSARGCAL